MPEAVVFGGVLLNHFGHAILECLSRLWFVAESGCTERIAFLPLEGIDLPSLKKLYNSFFELLDVDHARIIYIEEPTQFDRVIVPDETVHSQGRSACYKEKYTAVHEKMTSRVEAKGAKKIYLTRTQFKSQDCLNEEYFEEFYRRRGYAVIAPEQLSIKEQIAYMKGCEEVACTLGTLSHLLLFARPGTRLTALLRCSMNPSTAQMIVNHAKDVDFYVVDVSLNFLPSVHNVSSCFLLAPSKYWREYLDAAGEKYSEDELKWDASRYCYDYLVKYCAVASTQRGWTGGLAAFDAFDVLNSLSTTLLDKPLKREDYKTSLVNRLKIGIKSLKASKWWKLARPLKKLWLLLNVRTRSKIYAALRKRLN